jgi:hypothetical protein
MSDQLTAQASEEQVVYANVLEKGMYIGLLLLVITFAIYIFGIMPPAVPLNEIAGYWGMNVDSYLAAINQNFLMLDHAPTGWSWLKLLGRGDFLNFIGVAILSGVTILCYLAIVPTLLRKNDFAYVVMALLEVAILTLAASGILTSGGH